MVGSTQEQVWEAVGDFIHGPPGVSTSDVGKDDIPSHGDSVTDEVLVVLKDKNICDLLIVSSVNLAGEVNAGGRPTASTRIEVPPELMDTFRLLNRLGARLRVRHGAGTKRHIKFYDFTGSLFANVKLPGDRTWTKVFPAMARSDLAASVQEEEDRNRKRFAAKLVPGPPERLAQPMVEVALPLQTPSQPLLALAGQQRGTARPVPVPSTSTSTAGTSHLGAGGQRPRWRTPPDAADGL